ncbi:marvel domain-containing protein [Delphinella strobiligena]|nr:marvel domain-containing protein [Delphinella strobiligena]
MVSKAINLGLRGFEFIWSLLIMALVGNMIATAYSGNPSLVNYDMFVAVFSMLSLFYLIPATVKEAFQGHPLLMVVLDALNAIFFFCGAVAMAAELHVHSCGNRSYTTTNHITNGSHNTGKRCHEAQAVTAFLWFGFAAFTASAVLSGLQSRGAGLPSRGGAGGIRRGPAMSQV